MAALLVERPQGTAYAGVSSRMLAGRTRYFYTVARSSGEELKSELMISSRLGYIEVRVFEDLMTRLDEVCRMLYGLIESMDRKAAEE